MELEPFEERGAPRVPHWNSGAVLTHNEEEGSPESERQRHPAQLSSAQLQHLRRQTGTQASAAKPQGGSSLGLTATCVADWGTSSDQNDPASCAVSPVEPSLIAPFTESC